MTHEFDSWSRALRKRDIRLFQSQFRLFYKKHIVLLINLHNEIGGQGAIRFQQVLRNEIVPEQVIARPDRKAFNIQRPTMAERLQRAQSVDTGDKSPELFQVIRVIQLRRASTPTAPACNAAPGARDLSRRVQRRGRR